MPDPTPTPISTSAEQSQRETVATTTGLFDPASARERIGGAIGLFVICGLGCCSVHAVVSGIAEAAGPGYWVLTPLETLGLAYLGGVAALVVGVPVAHLLLAPPFRMVGIGVMALLFPVAAGLTFFLAPMHYATVCEEHDAARTCEHLATKDGPCEPGQPCYPFLERACSLGRESSCRQIVSHGGEQEVCASLAKSFDTIRHCYTSPARSPECQLSDPDLPRGESPRTWEICVTYGRVCGSELVPEVCRR